MMPVLEKESLFISSVEEAARTLAPAAPWMTQLRRAGWERWTKLGLPTQQDEEWRSTSVAAIAKTPFRLARENKQIAESEARKGCLEWFPQRLVFVDGILNRELSSIANIPGIAMEIFATTQDFLKKRWDKGAFVLGASTGGAFASLNAAFLRDGVYIHAQRGIILEQPIQIILISSGSADAVMSHPRIIIEAEQGSHLSIIEESVGLGAAASLNNRTAEIDLGENASVEYCHIQHPCDHAFEITTTGVRQARNSIFNHHVFTLSGGLVRNNLRVALEAEGAQCSLGGLYLAKGREHVDNHTVVEHLKPHGTSRELYKGVLDGQARAIFKGTIIVEPQAQKTDAMVYNKNLLLSDNGLVDTKPEFKIHANDVQCKHGSTIGQLPAGSLFYLQSRGIGLKEAKEMLVYAFISEMVNGIKPECLHQALARRLHASGIED